MDFSSEAIELGFGRSNLDPFEIWVSSIWFERLELFLGLVGVRVSSAGFWVLGFESRVLRFLGEKEWDWDWAWAWGFFLKAAARAPDLRTSKAEGREDMIRAELGFGEKQAEFEDGGGFGREEGVVEERE